MYLYFGYYVFENLHYRLTNEWYNSIVVCLLLRNWRAFKGLRNMCGKYKSFFCYVALATSWATKHECRVSNIKTSNIDWLVPWRGGWFLIIAFPYGSKSWLLERIIFAFIQAVMSHSIKTTVCYFNYICLTLFTENFLKSHWHRKILNIAHNHSVSLSGIKTQKKIKQNNNINIDRKFQNIKQWGKST